MSKTFNASGVGASSCVALLTIDSDNVTPIDVKTPANTITADSPANQVPVSGAYGYGLQVTQKDGFHNYGYTFGTSAAIDASSGRSATVFLALNGISLAAAGTVFLLSQSSSVVGNFPLIRFISSVGSGLQPEGETTSSAIIPFGSNLTLNTAHSLAFTWIYGTSYKCYIDGSLVTSGTAGNFGSTAQSLGYFGGVGGQGSMTLSAPIACYFNDTAANVLTDANIAALHASLTGGGAFSLITGGAPSGPRPSQMFLDNVRPRLPTLAAAPLGALAWIVERRDRVMREEFRQDKRSLLFLPSWIKNKLPRAPKT